MGIIFIGVGMVFLLNNFGILPWVVWERLINFWPVILIGAGLEITAGKNFFLRLLVQLFILAAVVFILVQVSMANRKDFRNWVKYKYPWLPYIESIFSPKAQPFKLKFRFEKGGFII